MKKILIYSGTTEGRMLAERLAASGTAVEVCVATEYGEQMMKPSQYIKVHTGRMDLAEMLRFYREAEDEGSGFGVIVDATHPYAAVVTGNIKKSAEEAGIRYLRLERDGLAGEDTGSENVAFFDDAPACAEALKKTEGKVLLTTGSKELAVFCADEALRARVVARILPAEESLKLAYDSGLDGRQIIAMHGPFSAEMNKSIIKDHDIKCLVTKDGGRAGGMQDKLAAAEETGISCYVIRRPQTSEGKVYTSDEIYRMLTAPAYPVEVKLVGIGMGSIQGLSLAAADAIRSADLVFGAERMLKCTDELDRKADQKKYPYYLEKDIIPCIRNEARERREALKAAVLFSGDTGFYSGCEKLYRALKQYDNFTAEIIPGTSSLSCFAAKTGVSWQDAKIISAHGVKNEVWIRELKAALTEYAKIFFLTSGPEDVRTAGKVLAETGREAKIMLGRDLSYDNEEISELTPEECGKVTEKGLYVGMILSQPEPGKILTPGVSDEEFIRAKVPMTKEEVRSISLCKLKLTKDSVLYDIGAGTGSVSVEAALLSENISVYAIETKPEACELIRQNIRKFGLSNVSVIEAEAPEGLDELPFATHAFIGGSRGNLKEILTALKKINPRMMVVANAVSMDTVTELQRLTAELETGEPEVVQLAVSKTKKLGSHHMLMANNPVFIYSFRLS